MSLNEQVYQIYDRWIIDKVSHSDLVWLNWQVIRLRWDIFNQASLILNNWEDLSLYNHFNPINNDLIRRFIDDSSQCFWWKVMEIVWQNQNWLVLWSDNSVEIRVNKMWNIFFEKIKQRDLRQSLAFKNWEEETVDNLIKWMSNSLYNWSSEKQIAKMQRVFWRNIKIK